MLANRAVLSYNYYIASVLPLMPNELERMSMEIKTNNMTNTMTTPTTAPAAPALLPQYATTPKRGKAARPRQEPLKLYAYAVEHGGRVEMTDATKQELTARGVPPHRIPSAVYSMKKYFGAQVVTERKGRSVSAYTFSV